MSQHQDHTTRQLTFPDRLLEAESQLRDVVHRLHRPGQHGAQYASDVYNILGALKVISSDIAEITQRATSLLTRATDHGLTSRRLSIEDRSHLECAGIYAHHLVGALEHTQTAINDIGGNLVGPSTPSPAPRD